MFISSLQPYQMLKKYEQMAHYHYFDMFYVSVCTGSDANSAFFPISQTLLNGSFQLFWRSLLTLQIIYYFFCA